MRSAPRLGALLAAALIIGSMTATAVAVPLPEPVSYPSSAFTPLVPSDVAPRETLRWDINAEVIDRIQPIVTPTSRPDVPQPAPKAVIVVSSGGGVGAASSGNGSIQGKASWYCNYDDPDYRRSVCHYKYPDGPGDDLYAAACAKLRSAMGTWRGRTVSVSGNGRTIAVKLVDYCASTDKTIDLYRDSMDALGGGGGTLVVKVSW